MIMAEERKYEKPSELFMGLICNGGTPAATCQLCGREHFDLNGEFMEEGELDSYLKKQEAKPEKYIGHDGGICIGEIDNQQVVWDCPCNRCRRFEDFIWGHRHIIASYLRQRAELQMEAAKSLLEELPT